MDRNEFIRRLFERAGADVSSEACYEAGSDFEVSVKDGEILNYSVSDAIGLGYRVLKDGQIGRAHV